MEKVAPEKRELITSGPIAKTVLTLAVPVVLNMFMEFALTTTDYYWVGKLGPVAQDAVTSSMVVIWTIFVLISIVTIGVTAFVSRFVGAKDYEKAAYFAKQGLGFSLVVSVTLAFVGYFITPTLLTFMETGLQTKIFATTYLRIAFAAGIFFFWNDTLYSAFRASGDTKTPTMVGITTVIINMILDPLLIFGIGPFPELGVAGASLATGIAVFIGTLIITTLYLKGKLGYTVEAPLSIFPKVREMLKIGKIGLPMSTQQLVFVMVYWFLIKYVHQFGENAAAAMGIGNRMESFSYLTCFGFSVAASTMVGQNLGAKKPDRAEKCAWGSIGLGVLFTLVTTIVFIAFPRQIATIFSDDPAVIKIAADYLFILGISQTAMAFEIVLEGAFSGAGDTIPPMMVFIPGSLLRIPLAYYLAFTLGWGINGIWWTLTITTFLKSTVLVIWFKRGNWKKKELG